MSAIRSRGRRGHTVVPNWRWEDTSLDSLELRIAGWLASHADTFLADHVTRNEVARRTGVSAGKVTYALQRLAELGIVEVTVGTNRRLVIDFDWDAWEGPQVVTTRPPSGHDMTTDQSPDDHLTDSHLYTGETQGEEQREVTDLAFDAFWVDYPRKIGKPAALRAWRAAGKRVTTTEIFAGLDRWVAHWKVAGTASQFIPNPATWLNQDRWENACPALVAPALTKSERSMAAIQRLAARGNKPALSLEEAFREMNP